MLLRQLVEQTSSPSQSVGALISAVKRADFFLNTLGGITKPLYRGVPDHIPVIKVRAPRKDRQPKDTIPILHHKLDELLERDFGVKYRSSTVFATSSRSVAWEYGMPQLMLPFDTFKFCWSPVCDDALNFFSLRNFISHVERSGSEQAKAKFKSEGISFRHWAPTAGPEVIQQLLNDNDPDVAPLFRAWIEGLYNSAKYQEGGYNAAHATGHELMIECSEYALVNIDPLSDDNSQELNRIFQTTKFTDEFLSLQEVIAEINKLVNKK